MESGRAGIIKHVRISRHQRRIPDARLSFFRYPFVLQLQDCYKYKMPWTSILCYLLTKQETLFLELEVYALGPHTLFEVAVFEKDKETIRLANM